MFYDRGARAVTHFGLFPFIAWLGKAPESNLFFGKFWVMLWPKILHCDLQIAKSPCMVTSTYVIKPYLTWSEWTHASLIMMVENPLRFHWRSIQSDWKMPFEKNGPCPFTGAHWPPQWVQEFFLNKRFSGLHCDQKKDLIEYFYERNSAKTSATS